MVQYLHFRILEFPLKKSMTQPQVDKFGVPSYPQRVGHFPVEPSFSSGIFLPCLITEIIITPSVVGMIYQHPYRRCPHSLMGLSIPRPNFPQPLRLRQDLPNASVCTPAAKDPQAFQRIRLHQQRSTLPLCRLLVQKSLGFPSCADLLFLHCASQDDLLSSARDMAFPTSFVCFGLCDNPLNHGQLMNYHYKHRLQIHIQSSL